MENKYFNPSIEDIRVGYEAEANLKLFGIKDDDWQPFIFQGVGQEVIEYHKRGVYRVPYLTKEQIEKEGWQDVHIVPEHPQYSLSPYRLSLQKNNKIRIYDMFDNVYFVGECKDINTFRYICKLLNISKQ